MLDKDNIGYTICNKCGTMYGKYVVGCSSIWVGVCDYCGLKTEVTESRDYDYPRKPRSKDEKAKSIRGRKTI